MSTTDTDPPEAPTPPPGGTGSGTAARRARQEARRRSGDEGARSTPSAPATDPATGAEAEPSPVERPPVAARRGGDLDPDRLAALEEERTFLLRSLDDLEREHDAGDVDDVDYLALKDDYTARAAAVIRSIEQRQAAFGRARRPRNRSRTLAWVVGLLVVSVVLGAFVAQSSGRRDAGDSISGDIRISSRDQLLEARVAMNDGRFLDAIANYDDVIAAQPANTEALTYKGWLLFLTSRETEDAADTQELLRRAHELLDDAVEIDPDYGDARIFRAQVLRALGLDEQALADLDAVRPGSFPADMQPFVDSLRASLEGGDAPSGSAPTSPGS